MTTHTWTTTRNRATQLFQGELPRAELEQDIINIFTEQPALVIAAVEQVGHQFTTGKVRSGWAVLRTHLVNSATPTHNPTATDETERDRAIQRAEQWIRTAGLQFDRESEVDDELFGDRGGLKSWATDQTLRQRLLQLYAEERPRGEQLERETDEADARHREQRTCQECGNTRPYPGRPCPTPTCQRRRAEQIEADLKAELEQQASETSNIPAELQA